MIILQILLWVIGIILFILILMRIFLPGILSLPYTFAIWPFIKRQAYWDVDKYFPEGRILKGNWKEIRREMENLIPELQKIPKTEDIDTIQKYLNRDKIPWRAFLLKGYGTWVEPNCEQVPLTYSLLKEMPRVKSAMFSILEPGKHLKPHIGFFKGYLRYHLGLFIPKGECYIIVNKQRYEWEEGEHVLFDDTYIHEAKNATDQVRIVLFLDVLRYESLPKWLRPWNEKMFNFLAKQGRIKKATKRAEVVLGR